MEKLKYKLNNIIIWGFSLGSGPAITLASKFMFGGLLLQSPIASIHSWVYNSFEFTKLTKIRENDLFENYLKIPFVKSPILILHGGRDKIVNVEHSRFLYKMRSLYSSVPRLAHKNNYDITFDEDRWRLSKDKVKTFEEEVQVIEKKNQNDYFSPSGKAPQTEKPNETPMLASIAVKSHKRGSLSLVEIEKYNHEDMQRKLIEQDEPLVHNILKFIFKVYDESGTETPSCRRDSIQNFGSRYQIPHHKFLEDPGEEEFKITRSYAADAAAYSYFAETYKDVFVNINFDDPQLQELKKNEKN